MLYALDEAKSEEFALAMGMLEDPVDEKEIAKRYLKFLREESK